MMSQLRFLAAVTAGSIGGVMLFAAWVAETPAWPRPVLVAVGTLLLLAFMVLSFWPERRPAHPAVRHAFSYRYINNGVQYQCSCQRTKGWIQGTVDDAKRINAAAHALMKEA